MYAQLPVFKYQTFGPESLAFSNAPVSPPPISPARYFGVVTDIAPKSAEVPKQPPADSKTMETPAEPASEPAAYPEGSHEPPKVFSILSG